MKLVKMYLQDDVARIIKQEAAAEHMSVSAFCGAIVGDAIKELIDSDPSIETGVGTGEEEAAGDSYSVKLRGKDAALLKKKAKELGILPSDWIRHAIYRKDLKIHIVQLDDLEELLDQMGSLITSIDAIAVVCQENKKVLREDVEVIKELLKEAVALMKIYAGALFAKRKKAQVKLIRENEEKL